MFEFIYSKCPFLSAIGKGYEGKKEIVPLLWTEHCLECAAPACYSTCDRYKRRADGNCIRFVGGVSPVITEDGSVGAKCEFRTWAKIESQLKIRTINGKLYGLVYRIITVLGCFFRCCASLVRMTKLQKFIDDGWFSYRQKMINLLIRFRKPNYALSLIGKISNSDHKTVLLVDVKSQTKHLFREAVEVPVGESEFLVNIPPYESNKELYFINLHPADAEEHLTLTFNSLELLPTDFNKGKKIKLVIWDLDNTLWNGVLVEDKNVKLNKDLVELIKKLDSCGVVNSIASKNEEKDVLVKLKELAIDDYFVFKKINWHPKSVNIAKTISQMNINANSVVFVDDNPFERNEVLLKLPSVTCLDPTEIEAFTHSARFKMIVTEDSKKRRNTYKMLESLKKEEDDWNGDINDFLRSCDISLTISVPTDKVIPRCYELLQRTNQLNSSGRRLSMEEVRRIVDDNSYDCYVLNSSDKFGDYGIVGFLIVKLNDKEAVVTDFVISCRVANKKIEPSLINFLANKYGGTLLFNYKKTLRNGPMFSIINELEMAKMSSCGDMDVYKCKYNKDYPNILTIKDDTSYLN